MKYILLPIFSFYRALSWNNASKFCENKGEILLESQVNFEFLPILKKASNDIEQNGYSGLGDIIFIGISKKSQVSQLLPIINLMTLRSL